MTIFKGENIGDGLECGHTPYQCTFGEGLRDSFHFTTAGLGLLSSDSFNALAPESVDYLQLSCLSCVDAFSKQVHRPLLPNNSRSRNRHSFGPATISLQLNLLWPSELTPIPQYANSFSFGGA